MRRIPVVFVLLSGLVLAAAGHAQTLDRIVAVVDKDPILESELNAQVQFFVLNNRVDPNTAGLREQVLQSMVNEKLIVAKAIEDSVTVTDDEVQQQLEQILQQRIQQAGSEARLEEMYGMPLSRIRREYRDEMRKNLLAQKLQQQHFGQAEVGRYEVEEFYHTYKDSLPRVPEEVDLSIIFVKPRYSDAARSATRAKMQSILDSIRAGADFATMAQRYSQDLGSAKQGGDLGLWRRGVFVKEFETAAFALSEGQVSDIVETQFGLHIIQLMERRGDAVRTRHILLRMERTQADEDSTIAFLNNIRERAIHGESFAELAKRYSEDTRTNLIGGNLGSFELDQLPQVDKDLYAAVRQLASGDISAPIRVTAGSANGYEIVWAKRRTPAHTMTLEQDYHKIETLALNYKRVKDYQAWIEELKQNIYWETRL
jgi:peptidyl-prolyl cis-trans isomerase SurA